MKLLSETNVLKIYKKISFNSWLKFVNVVKINILDNMVFH